MADYVNPQFEAEPFTIEQAVYDYIQSVFPDFAPKEPHLVTILTEAYAQQVAELMRLATDVPPEIFKYFGRLVGIEPIAPAYASALTTWTMVDDAGYVIPEGTAVRFFIGGDEYAAFVTEEPVVVPQGDTVTGAGAVVLRALEEGTRSTDLATPPELVDLLDYVESVDLVGSTAGGVDAEDIDDYLDRLATRLRLLADRPIIPRDFEIFTQNMAGVSRALALDLYDPVTDTYNNDKMLSIAALGADGDSVTDPLKTEISDAIAAVREVNFQINMIDVNTTAITIGATVVTYAGVDVAEVEAAVDAALTDYLHPLNWGRPIDEESNLDWVLDDKVRLYEVAAVINSVASVNYIEAGSLTINGVAGDLTMTGAVPMPAKNPTLNITVNLP